MFSVLLCLAVSDKCSNYCDKFSSAELAAACKAGCVYQQTARLPTLLRANDDRKRERAKEVSKIINDWCVLQFADRWPACAEATKGFDPEYVQYGGYCRGCDSYWTTNPTLCKKGCDKLVSLWQEEPWDLSYFE